MVLMKLLNLEWIKVRRTLLFYLCIGAPFLISIIMFAIFYSSGEILLAKNDGNVWLFFSKFIQTYWAFFFLPLFITLQAALMAGLEHHGEMWNLLYTQPVRRLDILRAKFLFNFILLAISQLLLIPATIGMGLILRELNPALGFESIIPIGKILLLDVSVFGFAFLAIAVQVWASLHWHNFVTAISIGVIATISGVIMVESQIASYYPWTMTGMLANNFFEHAFPWMNLAYSLALGILVILFGLLDLVSKETC